MLKIIFLYILFVISFYVEYLHTDTFSNFKELKATVNQLLNNRLREPLVVIRLLLVTQHCFGLGRPY